jgi:hypothetical protein
VWDTAISLELQQAERWGAMDEDQYWAYDQAATAAAAPGGGGAAAQPARSSSAPASSPLVRRKAQPRTRRAAGGGGGKTAASYESCPQPSPAPTPAATEPAAGCTGHEAAGTPAPRRGGGGGAAERAPPGTAGSSGSAMTDGTPTPSRVGLQIPQRHASSRRRLARNSCSGESTRLVVESPWSQFTSECQRFGHPPRLDKQPC